MNANTSKISPGQVYAVLKGTMIGSNLVIIGEIDSKFTCLNLPEMDSIEVPKKDMLDGIEHKILELLETIPDDIMDTCIKQHEKNINN